MRPRSFPDQQKFNPARKPTWRWDRAVHLVDTGKYYSRKRDDTPTGIVVNYLRDQARCRSALRLRRVRARYQHVATAREIWEARDERLELEARILARQSDVAIGLEMGIAAPTVQAYRDLLYHIGDRIDSAGYIMSEVIGIRPGYPSSASALMLASAYVHGPAVIEPWLEYLRDDTGSPDLESAAGRTRASIDLLVTAESITGGSDGVMNLLKKVPLLLRNEWKFASAVPVSTAFSTSTTAIIDDLPLAAADLEPFSYAPVTNVATNRTPRWQKRIAA